MEMDTLKEGIAELWRANATSNQIAQRLGITRGAVMGHIHRMKKAGLLEARGPVVEAKGKKTKAKTQPKGRRRPTAKFGAGNVIRTKPDPASLPQLPGLPNHVQLDGLRLMSCRFIVCESPTGPFYCGEQKERGSYCEPHAKLCYIPYKDHKKERRINNYTAQMARL